MNPAAAAAAAAAARRFVRPGEAPASDVYARALEAGGGLHLRAEGGESALLPLERWLGEPDEADHDLLARAIAPVIDVGCGPGRHVAALGTRGCLALGVDVTPAAVRAARSRGATVLEASVFDRLPTNWSTALLLDGNIGIGGSPAVLLERVAGLVEPRGRLLVELDPPGTPSGPLRVRLEHDGQHSSWFDWGRLSADGIDLPARRAGLHVTERWSRDERWFACLERR